MRSPRRISIGKTGLLSGPIGLCGVCLRRIRPGISRYRRRIGTALQRRFAEKKLHFGAGRCSWYPQNNATASTLASDKYFTNQILREAGVPTLGGEYFFLHDRHRAHRPAGHERERRAGLFQDTGRIRLRQTAARDRAAILRKPFTARPRWFAISTRFRNITTSILIQPIVEGVEYRIFLLDDDALFCARKYPPFVSGDGVHTVRELLAAHNDALRAAASRLLQCRKTIRRWMPCRQRANGGKSPGG